MSITQFLSKHSKLIGPDTIVKLNQILDNMGTGNPVAIAPSHDITSAQLGMIGTAMQYVTAWLLGDVTEPSEILALTPDDGIYQWDYNKLASANFLHLAAAHLEEELGIESHEITEDMKNDVSELTSSLASLTTSSPAMKLISIQADAINPFDSPVVYESPITFKDKNGNNLIVFTRTSKLAQPITWHDLIRSMITADLAGVNRVAWILPRHKIFHMIDVQNMRSKAGFSSGLFLSAVEQAEKKLKKEEEIPF